MKQILSTMILPPLALLLVGCGGVSPSKPTSTPQPAAKLELLQAWKAANEIASLHNGYYVLPGLSVPVFRNLLARKLSKPIELANDPKEITHVNVIYFIGNPRQSDNLILALKPKTNDLAVLTGGYHYQAKVVESNR